MLTRKLVGKPAAAQSSNAWTLNSVTPLYSSRLYNVESTLHDLFLKPDGTRVYIVGVALDQVHEFALSTPWDLSTGTFVQSASILSLSDTAVTGLHFSADGTKMYLAGNNSDRVYQANLSVAWDISTATAGGSIIVGGVETTPTGLFFRPDGTKFYLIGSASQNVHEYNLATPWEITSATLAQSFLVTNEETGPSGLYFSPDGAKMYVIGTIGDDVNYYTLSSPWNVSTAVFQYSKTVTPYETTPVGIFFSPDGMRMYICGQISLFGLLQFNLNSPWDILSAKIGKIGNGVYNCTAEETIPVQVFFDDTGLNMYIVGSQNDRVYQYALSEAWEPSTASYVRAFAFGAQEASPQSVFFGANGTRMYIIGSNGRDVNQYNLSTAWDVSTAVYQKVFLVSGQDTNPTGLFFSPDGKRMYFSGNTNNSIFQYNLTFAWDIGSVSYVGSFSVAGQDGTPQEVFLSPDGSKMFMLGSDGDDVNEYTLSTPWAISTASYVQNFSVVGLENNPVGLFFKPDGTKMYTLGTQTRSVYTFNLT